MRPASPPEPEIHLSSLKAKELTSGHGNVAIDKAIKGTPLSIDGQTYAKGLGTHANGSAVYAIPAKSTRFVAVVGLDDAMKSDKRASVKFQVFGDVKEMGEKPALLAESPVLSDKTLRSWAFDVELTSRYKEVHLVVTDASDGNAADHADWVNAGFLTSPAK